MRKTVFVAIVALVIGAVFMAACSGGGGNSSSNAPSIKRQNPPAEFANATNPYANDTSVVDKGKTLFDSNCATCHGPEALGNGPAGSALNPKPANLQLTAQQTSVQYIHWVDTVGGAAAGISAQMPSFKGVLTDDQIWQIANYLMDTYGKK